MGSGSLVEPHMSLREIERAILRESAGCVDEDDKNRTYGVQAEQNGMLAAAPDVVLHRQALAKKLLKAWLINLGFDPTVRNKYDVSNRHDWDKERAKVSEDDPHRAQKLAGIAREQAAEEQAFAQTDHEAWAVIKKWEDIIGRRAYALEKLDLVDCDIGGMAPSDVSIPFPDTLETGWEGTIQITTAGRKFLASGKTLRERRGQSNVDPLDRELEIAEDAKWWKPW